MKIQINASRLTFIAFSVLALNVFFGIVANASTGDVVAQGAGPFQFIVNLSYTVYGWIRAVGTAIALPVIAFGLVKMLATNKTGDAGGHKNALQLVQGGVVAVAVLWSLGMAFDLALSVTSSANSTLCSTASNLPSGYTSQCR